MAKEVYKKVKSYIEKQDMIRKGDRILLGLSGGADSVCLFTILLSLREELGFALRAAHVHHGIRREAQEDVSYVEGLCRREGIYCYVFREDVRAFAKESGLTEEEAGRKLRYLDFEKALREWREECSGQGEAETAADFRGSAKTPGRETRYKIATAHHMDDQAETVLFQLFRGSGLSGLRGILPVRENVIRPLLCLSRKEIEDFLKDRKIRWQQDATNASEAYSRNKIRRKLLPYAEKEICGGAAGHIAKTAEIVREAEDYIRKQTKDAYRNVVKEKGESFFILSVPALEAEDIFLQKQLILYTLEQITAARKDIGAVHIESIQNLMQKKGNGEVTLPGGVTVRKTFQSLLFWKGKEPELSGLLLRERGFFFGEKEPQLKAEILSLPDQGTRKGISLSDTGKIADCIPQKMYTKWFDCAKINSVPVLRKRRGGDFLTIDDSLHRKSIKEYMIQEKIPARLRDKIWMLADGAHIMWIPGGRMSAYYKVTKETKTIWQAEIRI